MQTHNGILHPFIPFELISNLESYKVVVLFIKILFILVGRLGVIKDTRLLHFTR